jgi:SAM-dependent methyltransferase
MKKISTYYNKNDLLRKIRNRVAASVEKHRFTLSYLTSSLSGSMFFNAGHLPCPDEWRTLAPFDREPLQAALCDAVIWQSVKDLGIGRDAAILDIGCGSGGGLRVAAHRYPEGEIFGIDTDAVAISLANRRLRSFPNVQALKGSGRELPFPAGRFDLVYAVGTVNFVGVRRFFAEAARVLRPGGTLSFQGWNVDVSSADEEAQIRSIANDAGFEVVEFRDITANVIDAIKADLPRRYLHVDRTPWPFRNYAREASVLPGTNTFELYTGGRYKTYICICRSAQNIAGLE